MAAKNQVRQRPWRGAALAIPLGALAAFAAKAGGTPRPANAIVNVTFPQMVTFLGSPFSGRTAAVTQTYRRHFGGYGFPADIVSPVGSAHACDLIDLLAGAIEIAGLAGSIQRTRGRACIWDAFERPDRHEGPMRDHDPPLEASRREALDRNDFTLARSGDGGSFRLTAEE
jgi:branched-chain amino acid transport system substrate-binding protein